jgi:hypothetical protein
MLRGSSVQVSEKDEMLYPETLAQTWIALTVTKDRNTKRTRITVFEPYASRRDGPETCRRSRSNGETGSSKRLGLRNG